MSKEEENAFYNGMVAGVNMIEKELEEIIKTSSHDAEVNPSEILLKLIYRFDFIRGDIDKMRGGRL